MADAATDTIDRDIFLGLVSFKHESLYEIDAALKRMEEGTCGVCELTGKPISPQQFARDSAGSLCAHPHIGALGRIRFERLKCVLSRKENIVSPKTRYFLWN